MEEAIDDRNPLLEKCKFAAIFASNLDEFFIIRVSRLFDHVAAGFNLPDKNKLGNEAEINSQHIFREQAYQQSESAESEGLKKLQLLKS